MQVALRMLSLITVCLAFPAGAQDLASLQHGLRIRVQPTVGDSRTGTYVGVSSDSLRYMHESSQSVTAVIPMDQVKSVQVSNGRGRGRGLLRGALIGSAVGLVGGAILGAATYSDSGDTWCLFACSRGETAVLAGALLGTGGVILGSIYGGIQGSETWRAVPLGQQP